MNKNETIQKIKELLTFTSEENTEVQFLDMKDTDGNILRSTGEELKEGETLSIVTEEGEVATPDMEYVLEDGRTIKTDSESLIIEIIEAEEEAEELEEDEDNKDEEIVEEMSDESETTDVIDEEVTEVIDELENNEETEDSNVESRMDSLEELVKELINNQKSIAEATMSVAKMVEDFGTTPVEDTIGDLKSTFSSMKEEKANSKDEMLKSIRNMRSKK